ncbi:MAG: magnesium chelatase, partial [Planctomycetes bacterium]|nr:magnesium chelatase [Planctomycetota bacterium]
ELPDLPPRIQVGLFNVLEERDVQIRGFAVRLNLDVCMVFSANPEDYTNRGRIVTPLKDRIGSVIRTHYPTDVEHALEITRQNAWIQRGNGERTIDVPKYMYEIIEETIRLARKSPHINQQSGVSVRASIASVESMISNAERRAILRGETRVVPRISDLRNIAASCRGKLELMLADDEQAEDKLITALIGEAVKNVFANYTEESELEAVVDHFTEREANIEIGDEIGSEAMAGAVSQIEALKLPVAAICTKCDRSPTDTANLASAAEFVLDGLYVNNRLSKYAYNGRSFYKR